MIRTLAFIGCCEAVAAAPAARAAGVTVTASSTPVWDPVHESQGALSIPGARLDYVVKVRNDLDRTLDDDTLAVVTRIPVETAVSVRGDNPFRAEDRSEAAPISLHYESPASLTDDVDFSADGGRSFDYIPVADVDGFDPAVTHVRLHPRGALGPGREVRFVIRLALDGPQGAPAKSL